MAGTWNSANMDAALSASNMRWYSSQYNPYGIELSDFIGSTATLGKTVANADAITNPVDYIARVIHKESSNVPPRLKDIYGVAQTIKNRGGSAINVVKAPGQYAPPTLNPEDNNWDPSFNEPTLTKEQYFVECVFLAYHLANVIAFSAYTGFDIGTVRKFFVDIRYGTYFFLDANCTQPVTDGNYASATYFKDGSGNKSPITTSAVSAATGSAHQFFNY